MDVAQGRDLVNRGLEIVRSHVEWLEMQYPAGIECIVCGILPPSFSNGVDVACPDFRCFLSPLRMALSMMGSKLGDTPKEPWWLEDCEPEIENPIPGVLHAIHKKLKKAEPDFVESDYAEPMLKSDLANLFDVSLSTIVRRIKTGALRVMPGTIATAKQVRIHGDDFPSGLKRPQERKQKLSPASKHGSRQ